MNHSRTMRPRALAGLALALTLASTPLSSQTTDPRLDGFDQYIESVMAEWKVPGLGVAIVEDGETVFAKGYGWRNVEQQLPVTPDTLFAIGSNTKSSPPPSWRCRWTKALSPGTRRSAPCFPSSVSTTRWRRPG